VAALVPPLASRPGLNSEHPATRWAHCLDLAHAELVYGLLNIGEVEIAPTCISLGAKVKFSASSGMDGSTCKGWLSAADERATSLSQRPPTRKEVSSLRIVIPMVPSWTRSSGRPISSAAAP
jgi:hypothetical protein